MFYLYVMDGIEVFLQGFVGTGPISINRLSVQKKQVTFRIKRKKRTTKEGRKRTRGTTKATKKLEKRLSQLLTKMLIIR